MTLTRRIAVLGGGATCVAALTGLVMATTPASAHPLKVAVTAQAAAQTPASVAPRPPLGRAQPSGAAPFASAAGTASPWTPLKNPPPFGTPGTLRARTRPRRSRAPRSRRRLRGTHYDPAHRCPAARYQGEPPARPGSARGSAAVAPGHAPAWGKSPSGRRPSAGSRPGGDVPSVIFRRQERRKESE